MTACGELLDRETHTETGFDVAVAISVVESKFVCTARYAFSAGRGSKGARRAVVGAAAGAFHNVVSHLS